VIQCIRYQSTVPNRRGSFPGVFALANGLASENLLSSQDAVWHRAANDRANALYVDPTSVVPGCFDPIVNAGARSWFKATAGELLEMTQGYLDLLTSYGVGWVELRTSTPGRITYQDDVQVVAVPPTHANDWPFQAAR
jgi:hypothetical protein